MWTLSGAGCELETSPKSVILTNDTYAMQILPQSGYGVSLSPGSMLPRGARVQRCGRGFDPDTVRVAYAVQIFLVFASDIET